MPRVRRKPQGFGRNQRVRQRMAPQPDRNFPRPERPGNRMNPMAQRRVQRGGTPIAPNFPRPRGPLPPGRGFPRPQPQPPQQVPGRHPNYDPNYNGNDWDAGTFSTSGLPMQGSPAWERMFSGFDNLGRPIPRDPNNPLWQQVVQQNQPAPVAPIFGGGAGELPPRADGVAQIPNFQPGPQPAQVQPMAQPQIAPGLPPMAPQGPQMTPNIGSGPQTLGWPGPKGGPMQPGQAPQPAQQGNTLPPWVTPPPLPGAPNQTPAQPLPEGGIAARTGATQRDPFPAHSPAWEKAHPEAVARRRARLAQQGQPGQPAPVNDQNPGPDANSLLLNPQYEAGVRALDDELSATLAQIGVSRQEAEGINQLIKERLGLEQREDLSATDEAANARGLFDSGIRTTNRNKVERGYRQNYEDIDLDFARTLRDLASGESGALSGYSKGLAELLMGVANQMAEENNSPIGMPTGPRTRRKAPPKKKPKKKPPKKRVRRRRKRR